MWRSSTIRRLGVMQRKRAVGIISARLGPLAGRVLKAATAPLRPMVEAAPTARVRRTAAATAQTAARPAIAPARRMEEAADTTPALLLAAVARAVRAAASAVVVAAASTVVVAAASTVVVAAASTVVVAVVTKQLSQPAAWGPNHSARRTAPSPEPRPVGERLCTTTSPAPCLPPLYF